MENKQEWYVVMVYANSELAAKNNILAIQENEGRFKNIKEIFVPIQEIISISAKGKKTALNKALYKGYIYMLVENYKANEMAAINKISKISKILGRIDESEIKKIKSKIDVEKGKIKYKINYNEFDNVIIKSGPFANFKGVVNKFDPDHNEVEVFVDVFNRKTEVRVSIQDVELISE